MTLNKDRKQTKYGHKRREHMTHTTEDWHNSPLLKGSSWALTVPPGRGGGRSGGPSGHTRTGTQDADLQSRTDRQGPWRSWELWKPWRCRELRRPWQVVLVALTGSLSNRLHFRDKGAGGWEWPPRPWLEEPPALDESPWTRQDKVIKMFLWAQQDIHTALLAVLWTGSTGLESVAIRQAWSPANGGLGGAATRELGNQPAGLG